MKMSVSFSEYPDVEASLPSALHGGKNLNGFYRCGKHRVFSVSFKSQTYYGPSELRIRKIYVECDS